MIDYFVKYFKKHKEHYCEGTVNPDAEMIIVIPCFDEPDLLSVLNSLCKCTRPGFHVGIIAVINSPEYARDEQILRNETTRKDVLNFMSEMPEGFGISVISVERIRKKDAGAGYARKIGMDAAVRIFNKSEKERGIIVSLDADCLVSENYLIEIHRCFTEDLRLNTAIIRFEHLLPEREIDEKMHRAGVLYELYLRYYSEALKYIGFPYPYHTIGSCFAVTADAYVKVGGMNRKQAGEDFYFLQKMFFFGKTAEIKDAVVYPSVRISDRVVFGTGPAIRKMLEQNEIDREIFSFESFLDLKMLFSKTDQLFKADEYTITVFLSELPDTVRDFSITEKFRENINEINANSSTPISFRKRFFTWFNAFMILRFLHFVHPKYYEPVPVATASELLLTELTGTRFEGISVDELLDMYKRLS